MQPFIRFLAIGWTAVLMISSPAWAESSGAPIAWRTAWNQELFTEAAREHRFVLLDLHAVWCHWCHVMDEETYANPRVRALLRLRYLPVTIDADADPNLSSRYGDWGWPATIVLAADGTEIVKRRGFLPPAEMVAMLQAIIDDPTPGPSVANMKLAHAQTSALAAEQRSTLLHVYNELYDTTNGGWGNVHKYIDAPTMEYTLDAARQGDETAARRARQTLDANLHLIDPLWGGVYQYSDSEDWSSPHFEKLLAFQADDLRLYAESYALWREPKYLQAALALRDYMVRYLRSPEGAFYVSQDADLSAQVTGHDYYAKDEAGRRQLGVPPIDVHRYSRENGWAIRALCKLYDVGGDDAALEAASRAADWVLANRALPGGGFRHDAGDIGGPFLDDTVSMGQAFLSLYRSTGERRRLAQAREAMDFLLHHFRDPQQGFFSAPAPAGARGVFRDPVHSVDQNAEVARFANMLYRYTDDGAYRKAARQAMKFLVASAAAESQQLHADILLADSEVGAAPIHITIVGGKSDPRAQALHAAALRYPAGYLQVDWWDRTEGPLPNPQIQYPALERAAAFACTQSTCSTPVFEADALQAAVRAAL
ncbi:MAG TPA: DUF255 domain-containing protein [Steroidobacteraceae bacterium]|nr:DUF255 domain-containing protein [Steroidobacteraceae bacterium]